MIMEGLFSVPQSMYRDIFNWVVSKYKVTREEELTEIPEGLILPKMFKLDLKGTRYEHLQYLNPQVKVFVIWEEKDTSSYFWGWDEELKMNTEDDHGNIYINLINEPVHVLSQHIEHEILHYVQYLLGVYKASHGSEYPHGGTVSRKILAKKNVSFEGYPSGGSKRVKHSKRPIEFYTNLNSAVRHIQKMYHTSLSLGKKFDTVGNRKKFFQEKLDQSFKLNDPMLDNRFRYVLREVRKENPDLYKVYLKLIYKAFVNDENSVDMDEVERAADEIYGTKPREKD